MKFKVYALIIFIVGLASDLSIGQTYFVCQRVGFQDYLYKLKLSCLCADCTDLHLIGPTGDFARGMTMSPDGKLYGCDWYNHIYQVDTLNGTSTLIFTLPIQPKVIGLVTLGGGIFYSFLEISDDLADTLEAIDVNTGIITKLGIVPDKAIAELTVYNGEIYYHWVFPNNWNIQDWGITKLNLNDPASSTEVVTCENPCCFSGLTATNQCQTLFSSQVLNVDKLITISLVDGAITEICDLPDGTLSFTSMEEFSSPVGCNTLDLDCNDSSGATDADFNAPEVNCLSNQCVIADNDLVMIYDDSISTITVQLIGPLPDAPNEFLKFTGIIQGINVTGSNTDMITLTNAGSATSTNFKNALHAIRYRNLAIPITPGPRSVEVQYTLGSGVISNLATAFISVVELPNIQVDLGPDQVLCEGETDILDAGNPGATYHWSNGLSTETISTNQQGQLAVTVSAGGYCPGADTVNLEFVPVINVSLDGPQGICIDNPATLIINTNSPFPLTIEIGSSTGPSFVLDNVIDNFNFIDFPTIGTLYTILHVTPSLPACVEFPDSLQFVEVFPTYATFKDTSMCEGDSLFIGNIWVTKEGNYDYTYSTVAGCDSLVTTFVFVWPTIHISTHSTTCDSSAAGVFVTFLNNPNGCDTMVQTTISLLPSDTTLISLTSCKSSNTGVFTQMLTNQHGCDSLVITTITLILPVDTTTLFLTTCDSSQLGVFQQLLADQTGCDSLVITNVTMAKSDTSYLSSTSCDPASIGIFQMLYSNQSGCDSLVISTVNAGIPDTTYLFYTSCDSSSLGVFEMHFNSQSGCDSTVFTNVSYSAHDSTFIADSSCDPADVGTFVQTLVNRFGCDSIITKTVSFLSSSQTFLNSKTCDPLSAGVFVDSLINKNGCDSIVTKTVDLLQSDQTFLFSSTCKPLQAGIFINNYSNQYGCDSIVTLTVSLVAADTTILSFKTCDPSQVGSIQNYYINQDGCDSLVIEQTSLYPLPLLNAEATSDFNGFDISCSGEADGSVTANVSGIPPFSYSWSTGDTNQSITNLIAGSYAVTITDANGCRIDGEVTLTEPGPFMVSFVVSQPGCFDQKNGNITVEQTGGVAPIRYSIDGINYQPSPSFTNLGGGTYQITALDANGCEQKEIIGINVPLQVNVELGDDQVIESGDTAIIHAIVNVPFDSLESIVWSGISNPNCPTCLTQTVIPIITSTYSVSVTSVDGCSDEDALTLFLEKNTEVFIPNIFSPNGDNINDRLIISAGSDVEEISSLVIFDRWGNNVFAADHFYPNDLNSAWDGTSKGKPLNSGVFAFKLVAVFKDGKEQIRVGDITLVR